MTIERATDLTGAAGPTSVDAPRAAAPAPATAPPASGRHLGAAILSAAMVLPGVCPEAARAESAPEGGLIGLRYLHYQDEQAGLKRIMARAPSLFFLTPVAGNWSVAGTLTTDSVSGASPRWHTAVSSASQMSDLRKAADFKVTRYFQRASLTFGGGFSTEHDYESRSLSVLARLSSEDNNTTWAFGLGGANDRINPVNNVVTNERKRSVDLLAGVTQVMSPLDIAQLNLTYASGHGYYNDPYKFPDNRPRSRDQFAALGRWNHHFPGLDATLRLSYRYYADSFKVSAHTFGVEWVQNLRDGWQVTPIARYHMQSAASFYYDPVYDPTIGAPFPPGWTPGALLSADQRLSAFGALTLGVRVAKTIDKVWTVDGKLEFYEQRGDWRLVGQGSPGLAPFSARMLQVGVMRKF
jgi:hypothetical protein